MEILNEDELRGAKFLGFAIIYTLVMIGCAIGFWLHSSPAQGESFPVPLHGRAPNGYRGDGDWATPDRNAGQAVPRAHGQRCPDGYYGDGNYCTRDRH